MDSLLLKILTVVYECYQKMKQGQWTTESMFSGLLMVLQYLCTINNSAKTILIDWFGWFKFKLNTFGSPWESVQLNLRTQLKGTKTIKYNDDTIEP